MSNQKTIQHSLKKDRHVSTRGGNSHFLNLFCSRCNQHLALYQKDGHGGLFRIYLDRIIEPSGLASLRLSVNNKTTMPNLKCSKCDALIGIPMRYEEERRLAFRLIRGLFIKKKSNGIYPPI